MTSTREDKNLFFDPIPVGAKSFLTRRMERETLWINALGVPYLGSYNVTHTARQKQAVRPC